MTQPCVQLDVLSHHIPGSFDSLLVFLRYRKSISSAAVSFPIVPICNYSISNLSKNDVGTRHRQEVSCGKSWHGAQEPGQLLARSETSFTSGLRQG